MSRPAHTAVAPRPHPRFVAHMKFSAVVFLLLGAALVARAAAPTVEQQVAEAVKLPRVTVVHFWAPWCPNCTAELRNSGWSTFIDTNAEVDFIFVTVWRDTAGDGLALLAKNGVGPQKNFTALVHENASKKREDKLGTFLGLPLSWIPTTWVFRDGKLRYALNYGELRFPILQQLVRDTSDKWEH